MDDRTATPESSGEASGERPRKRQAAKSQKDKKASSREGMTRLQLHLPKQVVRRLGVHCAMKDTTWSKEAARILLRYLAESGKGRESFKPVVLLDDPDPPTDE